MVSEQTSIPRTRRGFSSMMVAMGVILLVSALGVTSLTLARNDVLLSGSTLSMKTAEEAALAGIREVVGRMESHPRGAVAAIQLFVADTGVSSPHEWVELVGDSLTLVDTTPNPVEVPGSNSLWRVRVLGVDLGGSFGTTADRGIQVAFSTEGYGRDGSMRRIVSTYRMRGVEVGTVSLTPSQADTYALYINGTMGNSTIATDIKGDVYVGGNNHLNASVSITIDGKLRTSGNYKTSAPVTVKGRSYIGGYIEPAAHGDMIFESDLGIGGGFGNINAPVTVQGNLNLYGNRLDGWNAGSDLTVGGQLYVRDMFFPIKAATSVGGNAYFPKSFSTPRSKVTTVGGSLEAGGTTAAELDGTFRVSRQAGFRGTGGVLVPGLAEIGTDAFFASAVTQSSFDILRVGGKARFAGGVAGINTQPGIEVADSVRVDATNQASFSGFLRTSTALILNGSVDANFGRGTSSAKKWTVGTTWSYQGSADFTTFTPRVNGGTTAASGAHPTGPWRTTNLDVLGGIVPTLTPLGLVGPSGYNMGYRPRDTVVGILDNPPDTVILTSPVQAAMKDFSAIKGAAGVNTALNGTKLNQLFQYFQSNALLHNGYMVLRIDEAVSMSAPMTPFTGKCLLVIDANVSTNTSWPPSADTMNLQVLFVRDGDLGNNFGSPGPFWGYIHYEKQWSGNHSWPPGSRMFGSIYLAGPSSSVIGNGSSLTLERRASVFTDIGANLGILFPHGSTISGSASAAARTLVLKERWVQFDLVSQVR